MDKIRVSMEIHSLLHRLQRLETTVVYLDRTATEVEQQREYSMEATHKQLLMNQYLMQHVR